MTPDRELRVCAMVAEGEPAVLLGHWVRHKHLWELDMQADKIVLRGAQIDDVTVSLQRLRVAFKGMGRKP